EAHVRVPSPPTQQRRDDRRDPLGAAAPGLPAVRRRVGDRVLLSRRQTGMNWKVHDDPEIIVRPATYDDALQMGERLRESDRREVAALTDEPPAQALVS